MKDKSILKRFGNFIIKSVVVFGLLSILICQVEFDLKISKRKTGVIQSLTNIADSVYSGYSALTSVK